MSADVAIVGCGPVGATLANILGQAGVATVVHERDTRPYPQPRACHLDGEIMRIFQSVELGEQMDAIVEPSSGMEFFDSSLERIFTYEDFRRDPILGWEEDYVFIQPQLDGVLRRGSSDTTRWIFGWARTSGRCRTSMRPMSLPVTGRGARCGSPPVSS